LEIRRNALWLRILKSSKATIVCLQETKLIDISFAKLNSFIPSSHSNYTYTSASGSRGGTLTAWNSSLCLHQSYNLTFSTTVVLNNNLGMRYMITNVYGPVDNARKSDFLTELRTIYCLNDLPWILLGNFNIIRELSDTTATNPNTHSMLAFNTLIADLDLHEPTLFSRHYTWSNKRPSPSFSKHWEALTSHIPHLCDLPAPTSDHSPLFLQFKCIDNLPYRSFCFERFWLRFSEARDIVHEAWHSVAVT
jgi:hypothetical protein